MKNVYAVAIGRIPGFYFNWPSCQAQTNGFPSAKFKGFPTKKEAAEFLLSFEPFISEPYSEQLKLEMNIAIHGTVALTRVRSSDDFERYETIKPEIKYQPPRIPPTVKAQSSAFFELDRSNLDPGGRMVVVYCDGSKKNSTKGSGTHLGSGAYCRFNGKDYALVRPYSKEIQYKYQFTNAEHAVLSSPTMEYIAFCEVLWHLISIKVPVIDGAARPLKIPWKILFISDYNGVQDFTHGFWKPKETHIIKIHEIASKIISFLKDRNIDVQVNHWNGHDGIHGNEYADLYAKCETPFDTFGDFVESLSQKFLEDIKL